MSIKRRIQDKVLALPFVAEQIRTKSDLAYKRGEKDTWRTIMDREALLNATRRQVDVKKICAEVRCYSEDYDTAVECCRQELAQAIVKAADSGVVITAVRNIYDNSFTLRGTVRVVAENVERDQN